MLPIVNMEYDGVDASHSEHLVLLLVTVKYIYSVMLDPNSNNETTVFTGFDS